MKRSKTASSVKRNQKKPLQNGVTLAEKERNDAIVERVSLKTAKTRRGRKILASREPQIHEDPKNSLFLRGTRCSESARRLLTDLSRLRKPHSVFLTRKQEGLDVFRDSEPIEYLAKKNQCALFCYGSSTKQHPFRLLFGRTFEEALLDMYECHVTDYVPLDAFAVKQQPIAGSVPFIIAQGAAFEESDLLKSFRNYLSDFFSVGKPNKIFAKRCDHVITLTAISRDPPHVSEPIILFRRYRIVQVVGTSGQVSLDEVGPSFTLALRRHTLPDRQTWKVATKQPKEVKPKKIKNVKTTVLGETLGRVHVGTQDMRQLNTRLYHGDGKRKKAPVS